MCVCAAGGCDGRICVWNPEVEHPNDGHGDGEVAAVVRRVRAMRAIALACGLGPAPAFARSAQPAALTDYPLPACRPSPGRDDRRVVSAARAARRAPHSNPNPNAIKSTNGMKCNRWSTRRLALGASPRARDRPATRARRPTPPSASTRADEDDDVCGATDEGDV